MNIAPISVLNINAKNPFKKEVLPFKGRIEPSGDVFIRQNGTSSDKPYSKALCDLKKEASEYIMNTRRITYRGLDRIIKKYSQDTNVKKFKSKMSVNKKTSAQYRQRVAFETTEKGIEEEILDKTIFVKIPLRQTKEERAELLGSLVHEANHMFQYETQFKESGESFSKKYYANSASKEESKNITNALGQLLYGYSKFEQNMFCLMGNFIDVCFLNSALTLKNFNKFLKSGHGMDLKEITQYLLEDTYYETGDNIIDTLGEDAITDFAKQRIVRELEAYKTENEMMQKYHPDYSRKMAANLCVIVYEELINIINNLKSEKSD